MFSSNSFYDSLNDIGYITIFSDFPFTSKEVVIVDATGNYPASNETASVIPRVYEGILSDDDKRIDFMIPEPPDPLLVSLTTSGETNVDKIFKKNYHFGSDGRNVHTSTSGHSFQRLKAPLTVNTNIRSFNDFDSSHNMSYKNIDDCFLLFNKTPFASIDTKFQKARIIQDSNCVGLCRGYVFYDFNFTKSSSSRYEWYLGGVIFEKIYVDENLIKIGPCEFNYVFNSKLIKKHMSWDGSDFVFENDQNFVPLAGGSNYNIHSDFVRNEQSPFKDLSV